MKIAKKSFFASIIAISALVGAVYAATLLTQTFPAVTILGTALKLTGDTLCSNGNLVLEGTPTANSGTLEFDCGQSLIPNPPCPCSLYAFSVSAPAGVTSGILTPAFSIPITSSASPAPTASLGIVTTGNNNCASATPITSGTAVTFGTTAPAVPPGNYNYCLRYSGFDGPGGSIGTFSVSWS